MPKNKIWRTDELNSIATVAILDNNGNNNIV